MPPAAAFAQKLNEQIADEFAAHQQYVACAVYYDDDEALPQLASRALAASALICAETRCSLGADPTAPTPAGASA